MLKVLELFSGVGAWKRALDELEIKHIVLRAEICDKTDKVYRLLNGCGSYHNLLRSDCLENHCPNNIGDVSKVIDFLDNHSPDIILASPPCQGFSNVNQFKNTEKAKENNNLSLKTFEIIEKLQPKYFIIENVKNFKKSNEFVFLNEKLQNYYKIESVILNSLNFGIPQNRERIFILGVKKEFFCAITKKKYIYAKESLIFNNFKNLEKIKKEIKHFDYFMDFNFSQKNLKKIPENAKLRKKGNALVWGNYIDNRAYLRNYWVGTITSTFNQPNIVIKDGYYRRLTPKECLLLMGFKIDDFNKLKKLNYSDTFLKKLAGNSIIIPVIKEILKIVLRDFINEKNN